MGSKRKKAKGRSSNPRVLVVGGGAAALMSAIELTAAGVAVDLLGPVAASLWPAERAGGIDDGTDVDALVDDALQSGGHLAARAAVRSMAGSAAAMAQWLERIGVVFDRDADGHHARRRLEGMSSARALFCADITTALTNRCLDAQLLRAQSASARRQDGTAQRSEALLRRFEHHELVAIVRNDAGRCVGCIVQDVWSMTMVALEAAAVILATGGPERSFSPSPSAVCCESAVAVAAKAGALLSSPDLWQPHPAILPLGRFNQMLLSSALRAEGARYWLPKDHQDSRPPSAIPSAERDHLLEASHPELGSLLSDRRAARAISAQLERGRGRFKPKSKKAQPLVCFDISHMPERHLRSVVGRELDSCMRLGFANPYREPLWVQPGWVGRAGGLWVDHEVDASGQLTESSPRNHSTNIAGLYASSAAGQLYHGSNRLSSNQLLAALFAGRTAAQSAMAYCQAADEPNSGNALKAAQRDAEKAYEQLCERDEHTDDDAVSLQRRLRRALRGCGFDPDTEQLDTLEHELAQIAESTKQAGSGDDSSWANVGALTLRQLEHMLVLAELGFASAQKRADDDGPGEDDDDDQELSRLRQLVCRYHADGAELLGPFSYELLGQSIDIDPGATVGSEAKSEDSQQEQNR